MNKFTANRKCHDYERKSEYGLLKMYENDLKSYFDAPKFV